MVVDVCFLWRVRPLKRISLLSLCQFSPGGPCMPVQTARIHRERSPGSVYSDSSWASGARFHLVFDLQLFGSNQ